VTTDPTSQQRDQAWSQLMRAAQSGDRAAYEKLLGEISPLIRALVRRHCSNRADIEDMVQDTLLTLHRVRHTYDPGRPFCPWLAAIAWRRSIDALRRRIRVSKYEIANQGVYETFSDAAANSDLEGVRSAEEVEDLLQLLPPRQRDALQALKLKQMTLAEASLPRGSRSPRSR